MIEKLVQLKRSAVMNGWSPMRFVRLGLGLVIFVQGIVSTEVLSIVLGGLFAGMALVNIGCNGACDINAAGTGNKKSDELEETVGKK